MNIGPAGGLPASAAGAPLSQTTGPAAERAASDAVAQRRSADSDAKAEEAAGIGHTEQDEQASDRDADGRRIWERSPESDDGPEDAEPPRRANDPTGNRGNELDLTG